MANKLIISSSLSPQYDLSESHNGATHSQYMVDSVVGQVGGQTNMVALGENDISKYTGIVEHEAAEPVLTALVAGFTDAGTEPDTVYAFYVKYISTKGAAATVTVQYASQVHAILSVGESVCIPFETGAPASCKLLASAYSVDNQATVEVVIAGT